MRQLLDANPILEPNGCSDSVSFHPDDTSPNSGRVRRVLQLREELVPGYRLERVLGRGSYGEVWKASGPGGLPLALKVISIDDTWSNPELRALELMKNIRHPNLLSIVGSWQLPGLLIIAMELADGSLMNRFDQCRSEGLSGIPFEELIEYMHETAKGLDYLNDKWLAPGSTPIRGIQHRDIKPHNLMLVGGSISIGDFGLAKVVEHSVIRNTGAMTLGYAAPEFFRGKTARTSDQYCLAVTYVQMRTGRMPFKGSPAEIIKGHTSNPPDLSRLPAEERGPVERALSKNPEHRWPSCTEFIGRLARSALVSGGTKRGGNPHPPASSRNSTVETTCRSSERPPGGHSATAGDQSRSQSRKRANWRGEKKTSSLFTGALWAGLLLALVVGFSLLMAFSFDQESDSVENTSHQEGESSALRDCKELWSSSEVDGP